MHILKFLSLTLGGSAFYILMHYVEFEKSYDQFHEHADQLYRVGLSEKSANGVQQHLATSYPGIGGAIKDQFPQVAAFSRMINLEDVMPPTVFVANRNDGQKMKVKPNKVFFADASFLSMFSFAAISGNPIDALNAPTALVLTSSIARFLFGKENAIGKEVVFNGDRTLTVTAVLEDLPDNTHFQFDILLPYAILEAEDDRDNNNLYNSWKWPVFYTYLQLKSGANPSTIVAQFPNLIAKHTNQKGIQLALQAVSDIHLDSNRLGEIKANGSRRLVTFFLLIAIAIMSISLSNGINLSAVKAIERAKEVGIRKAVGASQKIIFGQFMFEFAFLSALAIITAVLFLAVLAEPFNTIVDQSVIKPEFWRDLLIWKWAGILLLGSCLIGGIYPALMLSGSPTVQVLKGNMINLKRPSLLRKGLIGLQFAVSFALISVTLGIYHQLSFIQQKDLGYLSEQVLVIEAPTVFKDIEVVATKATTFKDFLAKQPLVEQVTTANEIPGKQLRYKMPISNFRSKNSSSPVQSYWISTDQHFLDTYGMKLLAGRNFRASDTSPLSPESDNKVLLNERAIMLLGFSSPSDAINQRILMGDKVVAEIIGVVENHHQRSLKEDYQPILFQFPTYYQTLYFCLRIKPEMLDETIGSIESAYDESFPLNSFNYFFLDDFFNEQYASQRRTSRIFLLFTVLAVVLASSGLFGLASFTIARKTKEVSIRKILGASVGNIFLLLSKDYLKVAVISSIIVAPVCYIGLRRWLRQNYVFHIEIGGWFFLLPITILIAMTLSSLFFQVFKVAVTNPVQSLKSEG